MFRRTGILTLLSAILAIGIAVVLTGCPQQPQQPPPTRPEGELDVEEEGEEPEITEPEFQPADEFEFLVDFEDTLGMMMQANAAAMGGGEEMAEEMREEMEQVFQQNEATAEASDTMVRAHGEYSVNPETFAEEMGEDFPVEIFTSIGTAPVEFPGHFSADRRVAHLFVANPKMLAGTLIESMLQYMDEMSGYTEDEEDEKQTVEMSDLMLNMLGVEEPSELSEWMSDEMVILLLKNPDFDPEAATEEGDIDLEGFLENTPVYPIVAISADDSSHGLAVLENAVNGILSFNAVKGEVERTVMEDVEALVLPIEPIADGMDFYFEEDRDEFVSVMERIGPSVVVAVPGYVLVGARPALLSALDAFEPEGAVELEDATLQLAWNWDYGIDTYRVMSETYDLELEEGEDLSGIDEIDEAIREMSNVGMGTMSLAMGEGGDFSVDIVTSKESMRLVNLFFNLFKEGLEMESAEMEEETAGKPVEESDSMRMDADEEEEETAEETSEE